MTGPGAPYILGIDYLRRGHFKDPKGYRWAFGIAAGDTDDMKQPSLLPGLSEDPSVVGLLHVKEQQCRLPQKQCTGSSTAPTGIPRSPLTPQIWTDSVPSLGPFAYPDPPHLYHQKSQLLKANAFLLKQGTLVRSHRGWPCGITSVTVEKT